MTIPTVADTGRVFQTWELREDAPVVRAKDLEILAWCDQGLDESVDAGSSAGALAAITVTTAAFALVGVLGLDWMLDAGLTEGVAKALLVVVAVLATVAAMLLWGRLVTRHFDRVLFLDAFHEQEWLRVRWRGIPWDPPDRAELLDANGQRLGRVTLLRARPKVEWALEGPLWQGLELDGKPPDALGANDTIGGWELRRGEQLIGRLSSIRCELVDETVSDPRLLVGLSVALMTINEQRRKGGSTPPHPVY